MIRQNGAGGGYQFAAVLDGGWLIGVVRAVGSGTASAPEVPTQLIDDDALHGIWIGQRTGAE